MIALLLAAALAGEVPAADLAVLPTPPPAGFTVEGGPRLFRGAELYGHINGGSELFLELGFERLVVQRFARGDDELSVELYRMSDPLAALGVYLAKCGNESRAPGLEARHSFSRYQLLMVAGDCFVQISNDSGSAKVATDLVSFAAVLAAALPAAAPEPTEALPAGFRPGSVRVVRGPVSLDPIVTLATTDVLGLAGARAVAGEYGEGPARVWRVVVDYPDEARAVAVWSSLADRLDPTITLLERRDDALRLREASGRLLGLERSGARLTLAVGLPERDRS